jgi:hypothetical protein
MFGEVEEKEIKEEPKKKSIKDLKIKMKKHKNGGRGRTERLTDDGFIALI